MAGDIDYKKIPKDVEIKDDLLEWYDGLGGDLNAFTRSPDGAMPEEPSHQMEIEIRPKEHDDNEIKKIERQAEYQKALAFAKAVMVRLERLSIEEKDEETANKCKKEIEILTKKMLEVITNGKHADRKKTGRDNKSDEKSDEHAG